MIHTVTAFTIYLFYFIPFTLSGQRVVSGYVVDVESNEPFSDAYEVITTSI